MPWVRESVRRPRDLTRGSRATPLATGLMFHVPVWPYAYQGAVPPLWSPLAMATASDMPATAKLDIRPTPFGVWGRPYYWTLVSAGTTVFPSGTDPWSVGAWIYFDDTSLNRVIAGWQSGTGGAASFDKSIETYGGYARVYGYDGGLKYATSTTALANRTMYYVLGTYDGTNLRLYLNGVLEATTACSSTFNFGTGYFAVCNNYLGAWGSNASYTGEQLISSVSFWTRCLGESDAMLLYREGRRWDFYAPQRRMAYPVETDAGGGATGQPLVKRYSGIPHMRRGSVTFGHGWSA